MGVDSLARRLASAALQKGGVSQDYVDSQLSKKYDKAGGTITGDVTIQGDLAVSGTTTSESQKQLLVEDNVIATNANKVDLKTLLSGLAINKNPNSTYGIMYDPTDDTVKFGEGKLDDDGKFTFNSGEGYPLAIRADSSKFTDAHLVKWDEASMSFVDAGVILMGGDNGAKEAIQQKKQTGSQGDVFYNTLVGYSKYTDAGKEEYESYIDPAIIDNAEDNSTSIKNSGEYSVVIGGVSSNAPGTTSVVRPGYVGEASQSFVAGKRNINIGDNNAILNIDNIAYGDNLFIAGLRNIAAQDGVMMLGTGLIANKIGQIVLGRYNVPDVHQRFILGGGEETQEIIGTNPDGSNKYAVKSYNRKNLLAVNNAGDTVIAGKVTVDGTPSDANDVVRMQELNTKRSLLTLSKGDGTSYWVYTAFSRDGGATTEQGRVKYTSGAAGGALVSRTNDTTNNDVGQINLPTQTATSNTPKDDQAISAGYTKTLINGTQADLQASIDTKRDKITAPHGTDVVYTQTTDGVESSSPVSHAQYANSLPTRDNNCRINANIDCGKPNDRPTTLPSYGTANYLQLLRGTPEEWAAYDAPLMDGEVALLKRQNGRGQIRIGTGTNKFSELKNVGDITVKSSASSYGTLEAGVEYRIAMIEDDMVEYVFPDTPDEDFYAILVFDAPATAIEFATDEDAKLTGDNCKNGVFTPALNTHYTVFLWYDGTKQGFVRGVPNADGTWTSDKFSSATNLQNGEGKNTLQQAPVQSTFINTIVGYTKNDPEGSTVGADAYGSYVDPTIYNSVDNTTTVENSGENTTMLGGLSRNAGAVPATVRPGYTGDATQSFISGRGNINVGDYNAVFNTDNIIYGDNCFVSGLRNVSVANETTMLGTGLVSNHLRQIVLGYCNEPDDTSRFMIGGGQMTQHPDGTNPDGSKKYVLDSITRRTIFKVSERGNTYAYGKMSARLAPEEDIDVVRLKELNDKSTELRAQIDGKLDDKLDKLEPKTNSLLYGMTPQGRNLGFETGTVNVNRYAIPQRTTDGQIVLPNQLTYEPEEEHAISKQYADNTYALDAALPTIGTSASSTDLKKIVYTADADIPTTPEEGVEYACTDLIGEADLDPTFINKVNSKQNLLTFDTAPTSGSTNPVTSGGIYDAISKFLTIQVSDSLIGG